MRDLGGKTAFVTGGASGIGFAPGRIFAAVGMKVMLADIEPSKKAARSKDFYVEDCCPCFPTASVENRHSN